MPYYDTILRDTVLYEMQPAVPGLYHAFVEQFARSVFIAVEKEAGAPVLDWALVRWAMEADADGRTLRFKVITGGKKITLTTNVRRLRTDTDAVRKEFVDTLTAYFLLTYQAPQ